ncbi:MAG: DUF1826 domain-containing protein [Pseudomonadota bacterium]
MNFVRTAEKDLVQGVAIGRDPASLGALRQPGCAAAVWRRQMPSDVQTWLDDLPPDVLPRGRVTLPRQSVSEAVEHLCDMSGLPVAPQRNWLHQDIVLLANTFADLTQAMVLRLRLDAITTNACRRFHKDAVTSRLVCTYRGTGTQYGQSDGESDPAHIVTVPTGAPILLRGTLWPEIPASGLLHRSPPIEGTGEVRLVLVLDPIFDPDEPA